MTTPTPCGKCGKPIAPGETGLRHFGFYTAHNENRCIELLKADLAAAQEALKAARLFIAETGNELADPMYAEAGNRDGLAEDCKQFATGEMCAKYLDVKWQTERAIRAEERAERNARDAERKDGLLRECAYFMASFSEDCCIASSNLRQSCEHESAAIAGEAK